MISRIPLPKDGDRATAPITPASTALARTVDSTISSSTEVDFNASTTFMRVYAITQDIYMKWGTTAVTSSNFDEVIPANQICDFYIPYQSSGVLYTAATFIERTASATLVCIEK